MNFVKQTLNLLVVASLIFPLAKSVSAEAYEEITTTHYYNTSSPTFYDFERSGTKPAVAWRKYYNQRHALQEFTAPGEALTDYEIAEGTPISGKNVRVGTIENGKPSISEPESYYQGRIRQTLVETKNGQRLVTEKTVLKDPFPELYPPVLEKTRVITPVSTNQNAPEPATQTAPEESPEA